MKKKFRTLAPKAFFIMAQSLILVTGMSVMFFVMAVGHKKNALDILSAKLDSTAESIAAELRSNQAPNVPISDEYGVFIVNAGDGAIVIDHRIILPDEKALWEGRRSKFVYEMQKQKRGWIVYPDTTGWGWNQKQKMIRYVPVDEMGWILAVEISRPTEVELYQHAVDGSSYGTIFLTIWLGIILFWILTNKYSKKVKQLFTHKSEMNLSGLGGEEIMWDKLPKASVNSAANLETEITGLDFQPIVSSPPSDEKFSSRSESIKKEIVQETMKIDSFQPVDEKDAFLQKKTVPVNDELSLPRKEMPVSTKDQEVQRSSRQPEHDLTINVSGIKSPALKKMIQQLRGR